MNLSTRALCALLSVVCIAGCATSASQNDRVSAEQSYIEDIEDYAHDLGDLTSFEIASRADVIDFGRSSCDLLDDGVPIEDVLLAVFVGYDTSADQPLTQEETVLVTIYAITSAVDNFCPEHRSSLNEFLEG